MAVRLLTIDILKIIFILNKYEVLSKLSSFAIEHFYIPVFVHYLLSGSSYTIEIIEELTNFFSQDYYFNLRIFLVSKKILRKLSRYIPMVKRKADKLSIIRTLYILFQKKDEVLIKHFAECNILETIQKYFNPHKS